MATLESLPPDQRAVLQLVLERGRTYDEIAKMLAIDRAAVRDRALTAFDAIGPHTRVPDDRRALITDYLLGQLPESVSRQTHDRLGESASERAWARVLASELAPFARDPLPEIPVDSGKRDGDGVVADDGAPAHAEAATTPVVAEEEAEEPRPAGRRSEKPPRDEGREAPRDEQEPAGERPASRRGGAILLGLVAIAAIVAIVVVLIASGGSSSKHSTRAATATTTTPASTGTTASRAQLVAQVNLVPPSASRKTAGLAQIVRQAANLGLVIVAQGMPANTTHDAYAVWLYNSPGDSRILGFVNPGVKANGKLQTAGVLPANASHYRQLLVTLETQAKPRAPGKIVLQGALRLA